MHRLLLLLLLLLCAVAGNAAALTIRLCTFDSPYAPLLMPDGSGQVQELLRRGARSAPVMLHQVTESRARCLSLLQRGEVDATLGAFLPDRLEYAVYPMVGGQPDESQALGVLRFMVYRRRGSALAWDGHLFGNLGRQPVGIQLTSIHGPLLRQMGVVTDDSGRSVDDNLGKLAQNRVAATIGLEGEAQRVIEQKYRDEIEALPQPFQLTPLYLLVNRAYYQSHKPQIDEYWLTLRQQRLSPDYQQYLARSR